MFHDLKQHTTNFAASKNKCLGSSFGRPTEHWRGGLT